jgi:hypothetical protein
VRWYNGFYREAQEQQMRWIGSFTGPGLIVRVGLGLLSTVLAAACAQSPAQSSAAQTATAESVVMRIIVKPKPGAATSPGEPVLSLLGASDRAGVQFVREGSLGTRLYSVVSPLTAQDGERIMTFLKQHPAIEYAEPERRMRTMDGGIKPAGPAAEPPTK